MNAQFEPIISHFQKELSTIQVGRVTPAILDEVLVEAYGTESPLPQVASVTSQGPQLLAIQPWDPSITKEVERALRTCGRDYNPAVDGNLIRLPFPALTEEKRKETVKLVQEKAEAAKVQIKLAREEVMNTIKKQKADGAISEDDAFAQQKEVQKLVDQYHATITDLVKTKSDTIMTL